MNEAGEQPRAKTEPRPVQAEGESTDTSFSRERGGSWPSRTAEPLSAGHGRQEAHAQSKETGSDRQQEQMKGLMLDTASRVLRVDSDNPEHADRRKFIEEHVDDLLSLKDEHDEAEVERRLSDWGFDENQKQQMKELFLALGNVPAPSEDEDKQESDEAHDDEQAAVDPVPELEAELANLPEPVPGMDTEAAGKRAQDILGKLQKLLKQELPHGKKALKLSLIITLTAIAVATVIYVWWLKTVSGGEKRG